MAVAHLVPTGKNQRIVGVVVGLAVAAAVKDAGIVQHGPISLFKLTESFHQISEAFSLITVPLSLGFGSLPFTRPMSQPVGVLVETQERRELVRDGDCPVHAGQLVGHEAGRVGLKCEGNQVQHGMNKLPRSLVVRIKAKPLRIDLGTGDIQPLRGALHVLLDLTH